MMAFSPGWLENQSVWTHMSYKYMLQLLRSNLFPEVFGEMKSGGMLPYMNPDRYGRSLLECSSFIASSAFDDPSIRGRGFLARLSGATAEFLSIWTLMMIGPRPFYRDDETGEVRMQLVPALPLWLFKENRREGGKLTISFKLFGSIDVKYYNSRKSDLLRVAPNRYEIGLRDGVLHSVSGPSIQWELADKIRRVVFVDFINVYFDESDTDS
jgi:hypothetical protein